jgi:hypothetical protein
MTSVVSRALRLGVASFAYIAACVVAAFLSGVGFLVPGDHLGLAVGLSIFALSFIVPITFVPALAGILYTEIYRVRSWRFYALGGALAGLVGDVGISLARMRTFGLFGSTWISPIIEVLYFAFCGLVAGALYWAIAGRRAGGAGPAVPSRGLLANNVTE